MVSMLRVREGVLPRAANGGLFKSPGYGRHPTRTIDSFEIIMMRNGTLTLMEQEERFELGKNDVVLLLPGREHRGLSDYDKETSFYWLHFYLPKESCEIRSDRAMEAGMYGVEQLCHPTRPERLVDLLRQFLHGQEEGFARPMEADLLVGQMLMELAFHVRMASEDRAARRLAEAVKKIVNAEFGDATLSPGPVADKLQVNCDYLGRVFKRVCGESIGSFIIHRRLRESRKLLQESELNVNQVAMAVGFNDPGYFRRLFRKHYDIKPAELRKMYYRVHVNIQ